MATLPLTITQIISDLFLLFNDITLNPCKRVHEGNFSPAKDAFE